MTIETIIIDDFTTSSPILSPDKNWMSYECFVAKDTTTNFFNTILAIFSKIATKQEKKCLKSRRERHRSEQDEDNPAQEMSRSRTQSNVSITNQSA